MLGEEMEQRETQKNRKVVGTYEQSKNYGFVVPDNRRMNPADIFIAKEHVNGALDGQKVVAEIIAEAKEKERKSPEGKIAEILGDAESILKQRVVRVVHGCVLQQILRKDGGGE